MKIDITGPITPHMLQEHLDEGAIAKHSSINGIGGISTTLLAKVCWSVGSRWWY